MTSASAFLPSSTLPLNHGTGNRHAQRCTFPTRFAHLRTRVSPLSYSSFTSRSILVKRSPSTVRYVTSALIAKGDEGSDDSSDEQRLSVQQSQSSSQTAPGDVTSNEDPDTTISNSDAERPPWAPKWLPEFFIKLPNRPWLQLAIMLPLYAIHLFFFSTKGWKFKSPLFPNKKNLFHSIGYDSVAGAVVAGAFFGWRRWLMKPSGVPIVKNLLQVEDPPWKVPREAKKRIGQTSLLLFVAYLASGYGALFSEQILYLLAGSGVPLTVATTRAWKVLLGHLMWVYMGISILRRLKPFFPKKGTWLQWKWRSNWVWWAIGGYYVSALFFNMADVVNQMILPSSLFDEETVVSKLINPENKDRLAMAIGSIGPCVSAPVFEEVLYRGFLLPALACFLPMWAAIPMSSVLFAIHHLNPTMVVPLSMLGFIWAILYAKSGNLIVTILIHAMWNSRVFLGSLLGLGTFTDFE